MVEIRKKKVDEDWKRQAAMEKAKVARESQQYEEEEAEANEPCFQHLVSMIANQTLLQLGAVPNPMTGQRMVDMEGARFSMELMRVLAEKTKGNLTQEEQQYLVQVLYQIQMNFARAGGGVPKGQPGTGMPKPQASSPMPKGRPTGGNEKSNSKGNMPKGKG